MDSIVSFFADLGINFPALTKASLFFLIGALAVCGICRFIYRKKTLIGQAVSSSIAIVFICLVSILIITLAPGLQWIVTPLPLVSIAGSNLNFFIFRGAAYPVIATQLLGTVIFSFLVNLADCWIPKGKNIFRWFLLRCLTVSLGLVLHFAVSWLFHRFLPQGIVQYAPAVLLAILAVMLLTGALKIVVGLFLTTVNPLIAALYTFFFASFVGKQVTRAVLTTGIICGAIALLQKFGIAGLSIAAGALVAYIPFLMLLVLVWYVVNKLL